MDRWNSLAKSSSEHKQRNMIAAVGSKHNLVNAYYAEMPVMNLSPKSELLFLLPVIAKGGVTCDVRGKILFYNNNKNFMRESLSLQPHLLQYASDEIRDDFKIVLMVLKQDGA